MGTNVTNRKSLVSSGVKGAWAWLYVKRFTRPKGINLPCRASSTSCCVPWIIKFWPVDWSTIWKVFLGSQDNYKRKINEKWCDKNQCWLLQYRLSSCCCSWLGAVWFSLFAWVRTTLDLIVWFCLAEFAELTVAILIPFWAGWLFSYVSPFVWLIWALCIKGLKLSYGKVEIGLRLSLIWLGSEGIDILILRGNCPSRA